MAPTPALEDTFRKYKKGTETCVQWLVGAARSTGFVDDLFSSGPLPQQTTGGGRLKGKARKQAKQSGLPAKSTTYEVPIKAFVRLAKAVASKPSIKIPRSVLTTLRAVTQGREACAAWYLLNQDNADDATKRNNDSHQYFIQVLKDTLEILGSTNNLHTTATSLASEPATTTKTTNMFAALEVEETEEMDDIPDFVPSTKTEVHTKYKLEPSDTDVSFGVYCFLRDLTRIRLFVGRTWREFKSGATGLMAAALTMNSAIAMIEKLSKEFQQAFPRYQDAHTMHLRIIEFVYNGYCNKLEGSSLDDIDDEEANPLIYKEDGQFLRSATVMCTHTVELILEHFYERGELRLSMDERRFLKSVSQLAIFPVTKAPGHACFTADKVRQAASDIVYDRKCETWTFFAVQILWDTQRELGVLLPIARRMLEGVGKDLEKSYITYLNTEGLEQMGVMHNANRSNLESRLKRLRLIVLDSQLQDALDKNEHPAWKLDVPAFSLLQHHPSMCGLLLLNFRDEHHRFAINLAGAQGQILVAAHLYNAAHCSGLLSEDVHWVDMDHFLEEQGSDWVFVGTRPKEGMEFVRHLKLAMGFSIAQLAKDYREPRHKSRHEYEQVFGKIRHFEYLARYSELSYTRVNSRFKKPSVEQSSAGKDILVMADRLAGEVLGIKDASATLSSIDTLSAVKKAAMKDDDAFNFDALAFYLRCLELLRSIRARCMDQAPRDFPASMFSTGLSMNTAILDIFQHCTGLPHYHKLMFPDAVKTLHDAIVKEGSMGLDQAKASQEAMKLQLRKVDLQDEAEPSFENPIEDYFPLELRDLFGEIIVQDENGDCRMPFGSR